MCARSLALIVAGLLTARASADQPPKRPIPDDDAQKAALAVVADVYKPDYEKAKTPDQKVELAKKLLQEGAATKDDPVARFVLLRVARDIAAQRGDLTTAFDSINRISLEYDADKLQMQVDAATLAVKAFKLPKEQQSGVAQLTPLIDTAIAADRYDEAKSLATLALGCAREGHDSERIKQLVTKRKEIENIASEAAKVKAATAALQEKPTDPELNCTVGKFLCLMKGDWQRGVPMLALGSDEALRTAAVLELEEKPDSLKVGDAWWKISESLEGTAKNRTQTHAGESYRKSLPGLSGLTKTRVEKLVAQMPNAVAPRAQSDIPVGARPAAVASIVGRWESKGWAKEFLPTGEANNIDPKGAVDTRGTWKSEGNGKYSARLGPNGEWEWKATVQGDTMVVESFLKGKPYSTSTHKRSGK